MGKKHKKKFSSFEKSRIDIGVAMVYSVSDIYFDHADNIPKDLALQFEGILKDAANQFGNIEELDEEENVPEVEYKLRNNVFNLIYSYINEELDDDLERSKEYDLAQSKTEIIGDDEPLEGLLKKTMHESHKKEEQYKEKIAQYEERIERLQEDNQFYRKQMIKIEEKCNQLREEYRLYSVRVNEEMKELQQQSDMRLRESEILQRRIDEIEQKLKNTKE